MKRNPFTAKNQTLYYGIYLHGNCFTFETLTKCSLVRGGFRGAIVPPKTHKITLLTMIFIQFGKYHSRYKAILPSIVLSHQCCEVYFISLTVVNP